MIKLKHLIVKEEGIHAKPATILVGTAKKYRSAIILWSGIQSADMKDIFQVMSLGVKKNALIEIEISGEDEAEAAREVGKIISAL